MTLNAIPVIGWAISFVFNVSLALPFWICWTLFGIGQTYFDFLPSQWQAIPFWSCVGLFISIEIIKGLVVPKLASVNQEVKTKEAKAN